MIKLFFKIFAILATWAVLQIATIASAHDSRPVRITVTEMSNENIFMTLKFPPSLGEEQAPIISLDKPCLPKSVSIEEMDTNQVIYKCLQGLDNANLSIKYPYYNPSLSTFIKIKFKSGEVKTALIGPMQDEWRIPSRENFSSVAMQYLALGFRHILGGVDHLFFLFGLIYIARKPKRIILTVTGFTLAHALTVFLVALQIIHVSMLAVELLIALSIVFLAFEIVRNDKTSLTWRYPILVASGFGLVHGGGFAGALTELGLPQIEKITGLIFFNLGIELGQMVVILALFSVLYFITSITSRARIEAHYLRSIFGYILGSLAVFWMIGRIGM